MLAHSSLLTAHCCYMLLVAARSLPLVAGCCLQVGHSFFWRELFRRHAATDAQCRLEQPLLDALSRAKLPNCGVVECTLEFGEDVPIDACIRSARMLEVDCEDASEVKRE